MRVSAKKCGPDALQEIGANSADRTMRVSAKKCGPDALQESTVIGWLRKGFDGQTGEYKRLYTPESKSLFRSLLAAAGQISPKELSEPSTDERFEQLVQDNFICNSNSNLAIGEIKSIEEDPDLEKEEVKECLKAVAAILQSRVVVLTLSHELKGTNDCRSFKGVYLFHPDGHMCHKTMSRKMLHDNVQEGQVLLLQYESGKNGKKNKFSAFRRAYHAIASHGDVLSGIPIARPSYKKEDERASIEEMLTAIQWGFGVYFDRSSTYASPFKTAYEKAYGKGHIDENDPLKDRVLITLSGEHTNPKFASLFWRFELYVSIRLLQKSADHIIFKHNNTMFVCIHQCFLKFRSEIANDTNLGTILNNMARKGGSNDWSKMMLLFNAGLQTCPISGIPVFNPEKISDREKATLQNLLEEFRERSV